MYNDKQTEVLRMAMRTVICEVHVGVSTYGSMNVEIVEICLKCKHFIHTTFAQVSPTERLL